MPGRRRPLPAAVAAVALLGVLAAAPTVAPASGEPVEAATPISRPDDAATARPGPGERGEKEPQEDEAAGEASEATLEELDEALAAIARTSAAGDLGGLSRLLDDPTGEVGTRWRERATHLAGVPLERYELRVDARLGELTTDRVRARYDAEVRVVAVIEELAVAEQDRDGAGRYRRTLTLVRRDDGWRLADDTDGRALGLSSPVHLWDLGPVTATTGGAVTALHHPEAPDVEALVHDVAAAIVRLRERWPLSWSEGVVLIVPRDREELEDLLDAELHLDDFLAFATATAWSEPGVHDLLGTRVVVNPDRFSSLGAGVRERVLLHELLHVATRPVGSAAVPLWLEEGVAQALGEQGPSTGSTQRLAALGGEGRRLPTDEEFTAGGRDSTHLAYQRSWSFVDHLVRRHGRDQVVAFYAAVGEGPTRPGTTAHHLDAAARATLGADLDELVARWRAGA